MKGKQRWFHHTVLYTFYVISVQSLPVSVGRHGDCGHRVVIIFSFHTHTHT